MRKLLKFERDLAKQIKALTDRLHETKRELRLDPENVQKVVEVALELAGQPPLEEAKVPGLWPDPKRSKCPVFRLPALRGVGSSVPRAWPTRSRERPARSSSTTPWRRGGRMSSSST